MRNALPQLDKLFLALIFFPISPLALFLIAWWTAFLLFPSVLIPHALLLGITGGILIDIWLSPKLSKLGYQIPKLLLISSYLFYSICAISFFMGVPVFNILLGTPASVYIHRRARLLDYTQERTKLAIHKTAIFTSSVMALICIASAATALSDKYTAANLEGMLKLNFEINQPLLWAGIIVGGVLLVLGQYALTSVSAYLLRKLWP